MTMMTVDSRETFDKTIQQNTRTLVEFGAEWCVPCKRLEVTLGDVMSVLKDQVQLIKVDVDVLPELAMSFQVMSVPTLILFSDGAPVERLTGLQPKDKILAKVEPYL